jgi:hypothetical protein
MESLALQIGGLSLRIQSQAVSLTPIARAFGSFRAPQGQPPDLEVDVRRIVPDRGPVREPVREALMPTLESHFRRILSGLPYRERVARQHLDAAANFLTSPGFVESLTDYDPVGGPWTSFGISQSGAWFLNDETGHAQVFLAGEAGERQAVSLDRFLYVLLRAHLAQRHGMLLHAASVAQGSDGYLFVGPSGSGKTTIAHAAHVRGWSVLADDGSLVRQGGDGAFYAYRTPWNMWAPPWKGSFGKRPDHAIIQAVFFIAPDGVDRWHALSAAASAARLVESVFLVLKQMEVNRAPDIFQWLTELVSKVPCYSLYFAASCDFLTELGHVARRGREKI